MSNETKIWPIFRWANGWLSDDLFTWVANSFYFSNDMEVRLDAKSIYPCKKPAYTDDATKFTLDTSSNSLEIRAVLKTTLWWVIFTRRDIYYKSPTAFQKKATMSEDICDAEIFDWFIYITTLTKIYYLKDYDNTDLHWEDMANSTDSDEPNRWRLSTSLTSNKFHPLYASTTVLAIWDTNKVWKINKETKYTVQEWFNLQEWYYVRFLDELWWYIRATSVSATFGNSEVLLWDKVGKAVTETIPLLWYVVLQSCIYEWYHYLLTNKWLGLLNWYQYYLLKKAETDVNSDTRNGMCVFDDKLYFIANDWIYIYWAKNKNYNEVLALWHKVEEWYALWAIAADWNEIVITRNRVSSSNPAVVWFWYANSKQWEVQTMCYYWTSMSEIKQCLYMRLWYNIPTKTIWGTKHSWNIKVYYRTEADAINDNIDNWEWHEMTQEWWLTAESNMRSPFATTIKLNLRFQWIQFKFVLTNCIYTEWWTEKTKDTNLYSADLYYDLMLE